MFAHGVVPPTSATKHDPPSLIPTNCTSASPPLPRRERSAAKVLKLLAAGSANTLLVGLGAQECNGVPVIQGAITGDHIDSRSLC